ncbi:glutathione S-transferase family protein [Variovorax sp. MHTC-1]|uniref:glutathione S-transferase family protein n=1 Tax=Variovorax sp. MHTC-1 TaxID=2495593 RepID=UPI000F88B693|nr:glutathione S-transferase family protein [Variovorax sp. MHTC-1]RST56357.1 glutathione S-transferase family protein [Variovorax sp. MHTC-1]
MKLYEYAFTRSIRARWTLQELGVDFEAISVNVFAGEALRPEFLKLNPAAKLPVLVDGDFVLTESAAIVLYLAEKYGKFLPTDARGRAEVNKWLLFTVTELEQPLWRIAKNEFLYPEEQRLAADIPLASEDFRRMADVSERHMQERRFVVGDSVTVADFVLAYTLDWANEVQLLDRYPQLAGYMERMYARPKAPKRIAELRASIQS